MNTIRIEVEVPECLEVVKSHGGYKLLGPGGYGLLYGDNAESWTCDLGRQIAAAVEARKPKEPKFGVGDVVEWTDINGRPRAGIVTMAYPANESDPASYCVNGLYDLGEHVLTLVRRAAK